jgi:hypothetical protein
MEFLRTREQIDKLLEQAEGIKEGPTPENLQETIDDLRANLTKLIELSDPKNEIQGRVCGNREIYIGSLEAELAKTRVKAMKAASKKAKKSVKV